MKKILIYSILLFVFVNLKSQTYNIDSLVVATKNQKDDTVKVNNLLDIGWEKSWENPDSAIYYTNLAFDLSSKLNWKIGLCKSYYFNAWYYASKNNFKYAIELNEKAINVALKNNYKIGLSSSYGNMAVIYYQQDNFPEALEYYFKALKIDEKINNKDGISRQLGNIGNVYFSQNNFEKAKEYYKKALYISVEVGDKYREAFHLGNLGMVFSENNNLDSALFYFKKAIEIDSAFNNISSLARHYTNVSIIYRKKKNYDKALYLGLLSKKMCESVDDKYSLVNSLSEIGTSYYELDNYTKAIEIFNKCYIYSNEINALISKKTACYYLSLIYEKQQNIKKSLIFYKEYIDLSDSIDNEEVSKKTIQKELQYQYDKKSSEDSLTNVKQKEIQQAKYYAELEKKQMQQYFLLAGIVLVLVFSGFMFNRYKVTKKQKLIIEEQKNELEDFNEELNQTNEEILAQRDQIEQQKHKIEEAHNEVKASINYAERIQKALLDNKEHWDSISEHFILFRPRDVVSGDFYWAYSNDKIAIWAAADCTGHGVPGAFMSMLGVSFLNEIVADGGEINPGRILDKLRSKIIKALEQKSSYDERKDGMDIALCVWNKQTNILQFAGANNPLVIIRGEEIIEQKADKIPIGSHILDNNPFTTHEIQLQKGDTIYTFTDGFQDQFGGSEEKKYMVKRLKQYLSGMQEVPLSRQKELLNQEFEQWLEVGKTEQIDDVCVIGVKL